MRCVLIMVVALSISACSILTTTVQRGYDTGVGWSTPAAYTTADVRIITQRDHPVLGNRIICSEPSPDVAKALSTAAALAAQGGNGAVGGGFGASGASAEAVAELAGRSTALLGLRDGLYRACEAYANGVIGDDIYSLVVSRYGQLLTTLFLGQDITGAAGVASQAANASVALPPLANPLGGGQTNNITNVPNKTSANTPKGNEPKSAPVASEEVLPGTTGGTKARAMAPADQQPAADTRKIMLAALGSVMPGVLSGAEPPAVARVVQAAPSAAPAPAAAPPAAPAPAQPAPGKNTNAGSPTGNQPASPAPAGVAAAAALALTRMNEDYLNQDLNLSHLLVSPALTRPTRPATTQDIIILRTTMNI